MFRSAAVLGLLLTFPNVWGQRPAKPLPRFEDYPAGEIYRGPVAPPKIATQPQHSYRTRIRQGVYTGWGAGNTDVTPWSPHPNFAGNMIIIQWACGAPCTMMAMVDAEASTVYSPPITLKIDGPNGLGLPLLNWTTGPQTVDLQFRADSRLLIFAVTDNQSGVRQNYTYYFLWEGDHWKLLRQIPLREKWDSRPSYPARCNSTYRTSVAGSGTVSPSSSIPSTWNAMASRIFRSISATVLPVAMHPGRSGT